MGLDRFIQDFIDIAATLTTEEEVWTIVSHHLYRQDTGVGDLHDICFSPHEVAKAFLSEAAAIYFENYPILVVYRNY